MLNNKINIYLDDCRKCPNGFVLAKNTDELMELFNNNEVNILSLDHDLGVNDNNELLDTGYDFVKYFCENGLYADQIYIHSDNVVGRANMYETLLGAQRRGFISQDIKIFRYPYY